MGIPSRHIKRRNNVTTDGFNRQDEQIRFHKRAVPQNRMIRRPSHIALSRSNRVFKSKCTNQRSKGWLEVKRVGHKNHHYAFWFYNLSMVVLIAKLINIMNIFEDASPHGSWLPGRSKVGRHVHWAPGTSPMFLQCRRHVPANLLGTTTNAAIG